MAEGAFMGGALLESKLHVPRPRGGLVARPRLGGLLSRGPGSALTLVSAPAGFGKTTLLAQWLAGSSDRGRSAAWLSLERGDNDPAVFWAYLIAALGTVSPGLGTEASAQLESTRWSIEAVLTALLNDLAAPGGDVVLVLDDFHVIDAPDVQDGMVFLLEHLPPRLHLVIACRADPAFPLARMRARGELVEIRAADLRFTSGEAAAYLTDVAGLDLAVSDVAVLEERTEGWVAALQLAALSLRGHTDPGGFIARFAGNDRYIVDYLVEEVLRHQPEPVRDFLLRTSVLDRLTGPLCDAVTGGDDGARTLVALERANLFVVPLDERREWYRYHHLFADVLRARLLGEQPGLVPLLHQRAGRWYESHDQPDDAVRHALAAPEVDRAAHLMEVALPAMRRHRRESTLFGWLAALPDDAVRRSPVLSVFSGAMSLVSGDLDAVEPRLDDAERALAAVPAAPGVDTEELRTLPATIAVYRASIAQARGDAAGTAEHARRALDLAGPGDHLARGGAAGFLALAAWAEGDVSTALRTFAQAVASLHAAGNLVDELSATVVLGDMWLAAGRPTTARRLYRRALHRAEAQGASVARATADLHVGLAEIDCELGDVEGAQGHLGAATALGLHTSLSENRYRWFVASARVATAEGDPERAVTLLDEAERHYRRGFFPDVRPIAAMRARVRIAQGRWADAEDWASEHGPDDVGYLREFDQLTLARLLIARRRTDQAVLLLDRLLGAATGRAGSLVEIHLLTALAQDDPARAREALGRAWSVTPEPEGYARLFLDEGAALRGLLRDAVAHGVAGDHARRLLGPGAEPAAESLTERELQVLRLLDGELNGPQIARELYVSHNTLRTHTKHIFTKLDVTNRRAAVQRARERGLL